MAFSVLPIRAHLLIAVLRGRIHGWISRVPTHVRENIASALDGQFESSDVDHIARCYFEFCKRLYLERILPRLPDFDDPRQWDIEGLQHLDAARTWNRGAILVTAHLGYSRLIAPILRAHGYEVQQIVAGGVNRLEGIRKQEEWLTNGSELRRYVYERTRVLTDRLDGDDIVASLDVRPIFAALASNRLIMIAGDGMRAAEFVKLPLLGTTYPFPAGFMKIAMMTKAPVLPVFALEGDRGHRIRLEIRPSLHVDPIASVDTNLEGFARVLDEQLRKTPHLWSRWGIENFFEKALEWSGSDLRIRYDDPPSFLRPRRLSRSIHGSMAACGSPLDHAVTAVRARP